MKLITTTKGENKMNYPIHTSKTAPEVAKATLNNVEKTMGFVPNLIGVMAEAPALAKAYTALSAIFEETSFTATERQTVLMTVNHYNDCAYCMAAHSTIAEMKNVPSDVIEALRNDTPINDSKLEALRHFTINIIETRGWPTEDHTKAFFAAGYDQSQVLEVVLGIGWKTLSNYTNHIASTPLDQAFSPAAWERATQKAAE
jgi:uncharacterized peroxidase-related enzyme